MGQVLAAGWAEPGAPGLMKAGVAKETPALTINAVCGSGLKAVMLAAQAVATGDSEIVVAGGQENMSLSPRAERLARRPAHGRLEDGGHHDRGRPVGRVQPVPHGHHRRERGQGIRHHAREQDALALASQQKAAAAQDAGKFKDEIVRREHSAAQGRPIVFNADEYINRKTNAEVLAGLRPRSTRPAR
jgi:acetyl-CoA C-acetyltransferase